MKIKSLKGNKALERSIKDLKSGNMLISKRPQQFLIINWPTYFSKSKMLCMGYRWT